MFFVCLQACWLRVPTCVAGCLLSALLSFLVLTVRCSGACCCLPPASFLFSVLLLSVEHCISVVILLLLNELQSCLLKKTWYHFMLVE
jgi:hypothetical protein